MTDERSFDSGYGATVTVADGSPNGTPDHPDVAAEAAPNEATVEASAVVEAAADAAPAEGSAEVTAEASGGAETTAQGSAAATADGSADTSAESSTEASAGSTSEKAPEATAETPDLLTQLARAMQATAGAERSRATEEIDRRLEAQIAAIRARAEAEATQMRELAGADRKAIDAWAETEQRRIQAERDRRTTELESDLTRSLAEHGGQIDRRIDAVKAVVTAHRADVDKFFGGFDSETDPVKIAQAAGRRPVFPDLEAVSGAPLGQAAAETEVVTKGVGVMDPITRLGLLSTSPEPSPFAKSPAARSATADAPAGTPAAASAPAPEATAENATASGPSILAPVASRTSGRPDETSAAHQAPSVPRPISWLRRSNDQDK